MASGIASFSSVSPAVEFHMLWAPATILLHMAPTSGPGAWTHWKVAGAGPGHQVQRSGTAPPSMGQVLLEMEDTMHESLGWQQ